MFRPWKADATGKVTIRYRINPAPPPAQGFSEAQVIDAIRRGAQPWMDANPNIDLRYDGTTSDAPAGFNNVVGFGPTEKSDTILSVSGDGKYILAFNMILPSTVAWDWRTCHPPESPCDPYASNKGYDLQNVATHEWGHVIGLDHVNGTRQTMDAATSGGTPPGMVTRHCVTLDKGDKLGARKLYPTDASMPPTYRP